MVVDIEYQYEIGDMVRFIFTTTSDIVFHGVVHERWRSKLDDNKVGKIKLYQILCLEKRMAPYTIIEELIIEKTDAETN